MVRRDAFLAVGGFDTSLKIAEDIDLYLRLLKDAPEVLLLKAVAVFKRPVPGSLGDDDEDEDDPPSVPVPVMSHAVRAKTKVKIKVLRTASFIV